MGSFISELDALLMEILSVIKPFEEDVRTRNLVINEIRSVVACVESLRDATVEPFGSFVSNLYTRWGDLDLSIEVSSLSLVSSVGKKRKQTLLRDLMKALQKRGVARNIQFISRARVPLLIFESYHQSISCDISISNLLGQVKSKIFLYIAEIDDRIRNMILLVKEWAKSQNINNPKSGTLNSYSLSLLVIFHLQTCNPPILPPVQEIYAGDITHDFTGERASVEREIKDKCAKNIEKFRDNNMELSNKSTVAELFVSFFMKFSSIDTTASQSAICTYTGKWENRNRGVAKDYPLIIEDPFDRSDNAARAVGEKQLILISEAFKQTSDKLRNQEQGFLITSLVRPQLRSHFNSQRSPSSNIVRPARNQYENRLMGTISSANIYSPISGQAVHGRGQQRVEYISSVNDYPPISRQAVNTHGQQRGEFIASVNNYPPISGQAVHGRGQQRGEYISSVNDYPPISRQAVHTRSQQRGEFISSVNHYPPMSGQAHHGQGQQRGVFISSVNDPILGHAVPGRGHQGGEFISSVNDYPPISGQTVHGQGQQRVEFISSVNNYSPRSRQAVHGQGQQRAEFISSVNNYSPRSGQAVRGQGQQRAEFISSVNNYSPRSGQAVQGQVQQAWRPRHYDR